MTRNIHICTASLMFFLAACSGGGLPTDGLLDEVPSYVKENREKKRELMAQMKKASKARDAERMEELTLQGFALDKVLEENITRVSPSLVGREIPVEFPDELDLKGESAFKVKSVSGEGTFVLTGQASLTGRGSYQSSRPGICLSRLGALLVDDQGKAFATASATFAVEGDAYEYIEAGTGGVLTLTFNVTPWNADAMQALHHLVVKQRDQVSYIQVAEAERQSQRQGEEPRKKKRKP